MKWLGLAAVAAALFACGSADASIVSVTDQPIDSSGSNAGLNWQSYPDGTGGQFLVVTYSGSLKAGAYGIDFDYTGAPYTAVDTEYLLNSEQKNYLNGIFTEGTPTNIIGRNLNILSGGNSTSFDFLVDSTNITSSTDVQGITDHITTFAFSKFDFSAFFGPSNGNDTFSISIDSIPEPATWALLLAGMGIVGCALRRRQRPTGSGYRCGIDWWSSSDRGRKILILDH